MSIFFNTKYVILYNPLYVLRTLYTLNLQILYMYLLIFVFKIPNFYKSATNIGKEKLLVRYIWKLKVYSRRLKAVRWCCVKATSLVLLPWSLSHPFQFILLIKILHEISYLGDRSLFVWRRSVCFYIFDFFSRTTGPIST